MPAAAQPGSVSPTLEIVDQSPAQNSLADAWFAARATLDLRLRPWLPILVICWLVGMSLCSLRPLVGWLTLRRLRNSWGSRGRPGAGTIGAANRRPAGHDAGRVGLSVDADENSARHWLSTSRAADSGGHAGPVAAGGGRSNSGPRAGTHSPARFPRQPLANVARNGLLLPSRGLDLVASTPRARALLRRSRAFRSSATPFATGERCCTWRSCAARNRCSHCGRGRFLQGRILRLFGRPSPPSSSAGLLAGVLLPGVALASLLAAFALGHQVVASTRRKRRVSTREQLSGPLGARPDAPARLAGIAGAGTETGIDTGCKTCPRRAIARHRDRGACHRMGSTHSHLGRGGNGTAQIRRAEGKPIHPNFYFTDGAYSAGREKTYHSKVFEVYKELFEPAGISIGSISPRAGPRYRRAPKARI